jgi:hypothetical protein
MGVDVASCIDTDCNDGCIDANDVVGTKVKCGIISVEVSALQINGVNVVRLIAPHRIERTDSSTVLNTSSRLLRWTDELIVARV